MRRLVTFVVVAAAGLATAVGVTVAATAITDQEIGLDSEPLTAGRELAPAAPARTQRERPRTTTTTRTAPPAERTTTTPPPSSPPPPPPVDDEREAEDESGKGRGRGRGRGRGGDDDD